MRAGYREDGCDFYSHGGGLDCIRVAQESASQMANWDMAFCSGSVICCQYSHAIVWDVKSINL